MTAYLEALRALLRRKAAPSTFNSADWQAVGPAIRQRSFFSATINSAKVLNRMRNMLLDWQAGTTETVTNPSTGAEETVYKVNGLAEFRERAGTLLVSEGLAQPADFKDTRISNVVSNSRLQLIFNTNTEQAQTFAYWQTRVTNPRTLNRWPAARFFRRPGAVTPRDRHVAAEGQVRRYDDFEFWLFQNAADIGGFEVPWGPFGFNSYMTQQPVSRKEAEALGLVRPGEVLVVPDLTRFGITPAKQLNTGVEADVDDLPPDLRREAIAAVTARLGPNALGPDGRPTLDALKRARAGNFERIPTPTTTRTLDAVKRSLDVEIAKNKATMDAFRDAEARRDSLQKEFIDAYAKGLSNSELDEIRSNKRKIIFEMQRLESDRDKSIEKLREAVSIPQSERGRVNITYNDPDLRSNANMVFGVAIVERYTAKAILPKVIANKTSDQRAYAILNSIFINDASSGSSTVAHEITHVTEMQNKSVLQASMDFLKKRAEGQKAQSLKRLTGGNYSRDEKAYKDKWEELGGRVYTGKVYPDATEILTMGIERLDRNPAEFYQSDPEFFEFVIKTLQQL
jgi:hypothetical protein